MGNDWHIECLELNSGCMMMRVERNETGRNQDADAGRLIQEMPQDSGGSKRIKLLPTSQIALIFESPSVQSVPRKLLSLRAAPIAPEVRWLLFCPCHQPLGISLDCIMQLTTFQEEVRPSCHTHQLENKTDHTQSVGRNIEQLKLFYLAGGM